jgi:hypothetical protein
VRGRQRRGPRLVAVDVGVVGVNLLLVAAERGLMGIEAGDLCVRLLRRSLSELRARLPLKLELLLLLLLLLLLMLLSSSW